LPGNSDSPDRLGNEVVRPAVTNQRRRRWERLRTRFSF